MTASVLGTPLVFNSTGDASTGATSASLSVPAGSNKKLIVAGVVQRSVATSPARTITSIIHNGTLALSSVVEAVSAGAIHSRAFVYAANLGSGTPSGTIVITINAGARISAVAYVVDDLDQSAAAVTTSSTTLGTDSVTLSGGGFAVDAVSNTTDAVAVADYALTEDVAQTEPSGLPLVWSDGLAAERNFSSSYEIGSGSLGFLWTSPNTRAVHVVAGFPQVSGGGTTYNDTLSESVTLGDSVAVAATFANGLTEAITAADSYTAVASFASALAESFTAADSLTSAATFTAALAEAITLAEAVSNGNIYAVSLSESVALADAQAVAAVFAPTLAEAVSLAESFAAGLAIGTTLSEAVTLADALSATGGSTVTVLGRVFTAAAGEGTWQATGSTTFRASRY